MTRREWLSLLGAAPLVGAQDKKLPNAPVALARCRSYNEDLNAIMGGMFDQLGGLEGLVKNKTVTVKLNLTGSPSLRFQGRALGSTHYSHPKTVGALAHLLGRAGAKRIRFVESAWGTGGPLEEYLLDSGWNVRALQNAAPNVEFHNTNALGKYKQYATFKTSHGGYIFPSFTLNKAYQETDVFVSLAKLKNHATCGVTLAMKNCFGNTPASIYGDNAGIDQPNETPSSGRGAVCHAGSRQPSKIAAPEKDPDSSRDSHWRMPRITVDVVAARPIDLSIIDGVETLSGGEGPWIRNLKFITPGLLLAGTNMVTTDTVATAAMGYDPRAPRGTKPFASCDNTLLLAEQAGLGSANLKQIEVRGLKLEEAVYQFG